VFVEWFDPDRPNWGGYLNSTGSDFQKSLLEMVEQFGRPTKVEFRADDEGWVGPQPCEDCGLSLVECPCDEPDGRTTAELGTWSAIDSWAS
jgi:hypothetical protein